MGHDLSDSELYWTRKEKKLVREEETERYIRDLEKRIIDLKEIEKEHQKQNAELQKELINKNKIISLMAKIINTHEIDEDICSQFGRKKDCSDYTNEELCVNCIIDYFTKKASEEDE